jgi:hypothetical protein
MIMRFHPGLAIGHRYNSGQSTHASAGNVDISLEQTAAMAEAEDNLVPDIADFQSDHGSDSDDPELGFGNREDDVIDIDSEDFEDEDDVYAKSDDEEFLAMNEMYGFQ